jgi:hypothetical protein
MKRTAILSIGGLYLSVANAIHLVERSTVSNIELFKKLL